MIRLFLNLCKHFHSIKNLSEIEIHTSMQDKLITEIKSCPICGAPGHAFHKDGFYQRDFICYEKEQPVYHRITVFCTECSSCGHSHALQLSVIVPYSSYSIGSHILTMHIFSQQQNRCGFCFSHVVPLLRTFHHLLGTMRQEYYKRM